MTLNDLTGGVRTPFTLHCGSLIFNGQLKVAIAGSKW